MTQKEIAIKVTNLEKTFYPQSSSKTVKETFISIGRKLNGKKQLTHHQGEYTALRDVSFEIPSGEFFGIIGRNGSGKSTLLKILAGVYTSTKGNIETRGRLTPFIELGVGFNPELSGRDNVFLNGALLGFTHRQMEEMYDDIVEFAELADFMDTKLKNYSSGMQVRLAFSVAIRAESDILLIDEVLAVGDVNFQKKCFEYFRKLKEDRKTVVFVSHDMAAIKEYCDNAVLIDSSRQIATIGIDDALEKYMDIMNPERLLVQNDNKQELEKKESKKARLLDVVTKVNHEKIQLIFKFKMAKGWNPEDIYTAFSIKNNIGQPIIAYNTARLSQKIKAEPKDNIYIVTFGLDNVLTDGKYYINFAVVNTDGHPIQKFEDCTSFNFKGRECSVTLINPNIKVNQ